MTATMTQPKTLPAPPTTRDVYRMEQQIKLIADTTRIRILLLLETGERTVTELCSTIGVTQPAISHHLSMLRVSSVVEGRRAGKHIHYSLTALGRRCVKAAKSMSA